MRAFIPTLFVLLAACTLALPASALAENNTASQEETPAVEPPVEPKKPDSTEAFWSLTPQQAFLEAAKQNKLSILIFLNPGEVDSDRVSNEALKDKAVLKWLKENSIAIKEVVGQDSGWIQRKGISLFPTVSIRTSNRRIIDIVHGYRSPKEWLALLDTAKRSANATTKPDGEAATDPYSWMAYGSYLFGNAGNPDEIGNAFFWCLDYAFENDPEFIEKHLAFLLRKLVQVARLTPNIKQGIRIRRDALHGKVTSGEASFFEAYALSQFGIYMRDMDDPIRAFNKIEADTEHKYALKSILMWNNLERMVAYRRYADILTHMPNPLQAMEARIAAIVALEKGVEPEAVSEALDIPRPPGAKTSAATEGDAKAPKVIPEAPLPGVRQTRRAMIIDASLLFECLVAIDKIDEAKVLMVKVTDFEPTGKTYSFFIERASRLKNKELIQEIADRGIERVPEDQIWIINNQVIRGTRGVDNK
ncbi:MAG: hypothetical protein ACI9X4_001692 [Glaciecola sp.]|jgi:hypothetical protein